MLTESLMLTCGVEAFQKRDVMMLDIPSTCIQASIPVKDVGEQIVMKIRGELVK